MYKNEGNRRVYIELLKKSGRMVPVEPLLKGHYSIESAALALPTRYVCDATLVVRKRQSIDRREASPDSINLLIEKSHEVFTVMIKSFTIKRKVLRSLVY